MNDLAYSGVNTTVRIMEGQLLKRDDFEAMLKAPSLASALDLLSKSAYDFNAEEVLQSKDFESFLMKGLQDAYQELIEIVPTKGLLEVFSTLYTYHNLKVLLKEKFSGKDFDSLLIDIGAYPLDTLRALVESAKNDNLPQVMVKAVSEAFEEFENFKRFETADIIMDTYYFRHLKYLDKLLDNPIVHQIITCTIDLENIATLIRGIKQKQSRSFMQTVLSSAGTASKTTMIDTSQNENWSQVLELFEALSIKDELAEILNHDTMDIEIIQLELLKDRTIYNLLKDATFEPFGPFPSLAYIHAKEMEVKNLRLLLVGKDNGFSEQQIRERMRPIYGS